MKECNSEEAKGSQAKGSQQLLNGCSCSVSQNNSVILQMYELYDGIV